MISVFSPEFAFWSVICVMVGFGVAKAHSQIASLRVTRLAKRFRDNLIELKRLGLNVEIGLDQEGRPKIASIGNDQVSVRYEDHLSKDPSENTPSKVGERMIRALEEKVSV